MERKINGEKPIFDSSDELDDMLRVYGPEKFKKMWEECKPRLKHMGKKIGKIIYGTN